MNKIAGFYRLLDEKYHYDRFPIDAPTDRCRLGIDDDHIYFLDDIDDEIFMILPREQYKLIMDVTEVCICAKEETKHPHVFNLLRLDIMKVLPPWYEDGDHIDKNSYEWFNIEPIGIYDHPNRNKVTDALYDKLSSVTKDCDFIKSYHSEDD